MGRIKYFNVYVYRGAVRPCDLKALLDRLRAAGELPVVYNQYGKKVKA